jgi:ribosome modulation factor
MASRTIKATPTAAETETAKFNMSNRARVIAESFDEMYDLDIKIRDLTEKHLKDLRIRKNEIKGKLRDDFGLTAKMVGTRYASYRVEREAYESGDETVLDMIKELFAATPIGGQVDMLHALTPEGEAGTEGFVDGAKEATSEAEAYNAGFNAGLGGKTMDGSPYKGAKNKRKLAAYETGWSDGQERLVLNNGQAATQTAGATAH